MSFLDPGLNLRILGKWDVAIFTLSGQVVRTLAFCPREPGSNLIIYQGGNWRRFQRTRREVPENWYDSSSVSEETVPKPSMVVLLRWIA